MSGDLAVAHNADALAQLDPAARELAVTQYLSHARDQLAVAVQMTGPAAVAALKAEIATAAEATKQLGLSRDIQQDAQEMVRRAEYALGKAIRAGQDRGEIRRPAEGGGPSRDYMRQDRVVHVDPVIQTERKSSPLEYANKSELHGARGDDGIYALVDGVSKPEFDAALSDAKAEGNLSRANVVRKVRGVKSDCLTPVEKLAALRDMAPTGASSHQISREVGWSPEYVREQARNHGIDIVADRVVGRVKRIDSNRIVQETVTTLEGVASGIRLVNIDDLDPAQAKNWADSLNESIRALNRLTRQIKELTQ